MGKEPPRRGTERPGDARDGEAGAARQPMVNPAMAMQLTIGNAATARLLRQPAPQAERHPLAPPPTFMDVEPPLISVDESNRPLVLADPTPEVPDEVAAGLIAVRATLSKVPKLSDKDGATLRAAIPGAEILQLIERRDTRRGWLENYPSMVTSIAPPAGQPDDAVAYQLHSLEQTAEVYRQEVLDLQGRIDALVAKSGCADEAALATLVGETFPKMFIQRAKVIAKRQLDQNLTIADAEAERYGVAANPGGMYGGSTFGGTPDYMGGLADPAAVRGLRNAAAELLALRKVREDAEPKTRRLMRMEDEFDAAQAGDPDPSGRMALQAAVEAEEAARARLGVQFPILWKLDAQVIADASDEQLTSSVMGKVAALRKNIEETKANIDDGDLEIWNLRGIVDLTRLDLGIAADSPLVAAIDAHIAEAKADESILHTALMALQITAGIISAFATGGVSLIAGGVALGIGAYQVSDAVNDYFVESAAGSVALDPAIADISVNEPRLMPIVIGVLGMGLDGAAVVKAITTLRGPARALLDGGDISEFAVAAHKALPGAEADRLIERVALSPELVARGAVGAGGAPSTALWTHSQIQDLFVKAFRREGPSANHVVIHQSQAAYDAVRTAHNMPADTLGFYIPSADEATDAFRAMGVIHLPPDANVLTAIHESLHAIGDVNGVPGLLGGYMDEGLTEWLAREAFGPEAGRAVYESNLAFVRTVETAVGKSALEEAYLRRNWGPLRQALESRLGGAGPTSRFYAALRQVGPNGENGEALDEALALLFPAKGP